MNAFACPIELPDSAMIKSRTPEEEELHALKNKLYSLTLSARAVKRLLEKGESQKALETLKAVIREAESKNPPAE